MTIDSRSAGHGSIGSTNQNTLVHVSEGHGGTVSTPVRSTEFDFGTLGLFVP